MYISKNLDIITNVSVVCVPPFSIRIINSATSATFL